MLISPVDRPQDVLTPDLWRALCTANAVLIDELITGLQELNDGAAVEELAITTWLPPAYLRSYDQLFLRRFLICLASVGLKIRLPDFHPAGCVAEEIAAFATLECARTIEPDRLEREFDVWQRLALKSAGIEALYALPPGDASARPGPANAFCFDVWFAPYSSADAVHPYLGEATLPLRARP